MEKQGEKIEGLISAKIKLQKQCSELRRKKINSCESLASSRETIDRQWLEIRELETQNIDLQKIVEQAETGVVETFAEGKYTDAVCEVVMGLLNLNIDIRSVAPAIKIVVETLTNSKVERLPSYGTINKLMYEGRCISLLNAGHEMLREKMEKEPANFVLNDGITKARKKYKTTIISCSEGYRQVGLEMLPTEDSDTLLDMNKSVLTEICVLMEKWSYVSSQTL